MIKKILKSTIYCILFKDSHCVASTQNQILISTKHFVYLVDICSRSGFLLTVESYLDIKEVYLVLI